MGGAREERPRFALLLACVSAAERKTATRGGWGSCWLTVRNAEAPELRCVLTELRGTAATSAPRGFNHNLATRTWRTVSDPLWIRSIL